VVTVFDYQEKDAAGMARFRRMYEGWNFNSGNYLFTTDTK